MLKCFVDIDGVLTDFPRAYNERYKLTIPLERFNEREFPLVIGKSIKKIDAELDREFWATLPWMKYGQGIMSVLESYFGSQNICLLSFPSYSPGGPSGKADWVVKNLAAYSMRFIMATDKRFCAGTERILFDDKERNVEEFKEAGGRGILVPAPWNKLGWSDARVISHLKTQIERFLWSQGKIFNKVVKNYL